MSNRPRLISGIQPTGRLHLGNYLGALKNFVALQNSGKYDCYFFIADLHSLTEDFSPNEKPKQILELYADFLAAGLDPKKSVIFLQSQIPAHTELMWVLTTLASDGDLRRMTQFKDKSHREQNVNFGLLAYPVLMAADILLYDAKFVPVGEDQLQHLELTRTLARKFNSHFGKTFTEPKNLLTETPRVMSLQNPMKKMSKSDPAGCLFLDDSPEDIKKKIKSAVTDSGRDIKSDWQNKPAISNLLQIYAALSKKTVPQMEREFKHLTYSEFKSDLANFLIQYFAGFREMKFKLKTKSSKLKAVLASGSKKANKIASAKMTLVKKKVGLKI